MIQVENTCYRQFIGSMSGNKDVKKQARKCAKELNKMQKDRCYIERKK